MIIDEIWVPDSLKNPKAMRKYVDIILDFKESNKIKPIGLIGSYCQAGQEYFAYQVAMEIENPLNLSNLKKARLDDLIVRR